MRCAMRLLSEGLNSRNNTFFLKKERICAKKINYRHRLTQINTKLSFLKKGFAPLV